MLTYNWISEHLWKSKQWGTIGKPNAFGIPAPIVFMQDSNKYIKKYVGNLFHKST